MLVKELQSLCLDIQVLDEDGNQIELKEDEDALDTFNLARMDADDDRHRTAMPTRTSWPDAGFDYVARRGSGRFDDGDDEEFGSFKEGSIDDYNELQQHF